MKEAKFSVIEKYLRDHFKDSTIQQEKDCKVEAQPFKVLIGNESYLLKLSLEFIEDNDELAIVKKLDQWQVVESLKGERNRIVLVTNYGVEYKPR